jgi:SAM-dependent methyltransferase
MKKWSFGKMIVPVLNKVSLEGGSRILDVGCGMGPLLDVLSSKGFEVFGLEIGKKSWEFANRRHPNHVFQGFLCDTPFHDDFFDLITMYDVIEHMQDPIGAMHQARRLLKPGGWVYLLTPNIFSINSRLFGQHWYQYKPNEHLFYFSPTSLDLLLRRCRFDEVTIQAAGVYTDLARISHPRVASSPLLAKLLSVFRNIRVSFRVWVPSGHVCAFGRKEY